MARSTKERSLWIALCVISRLLVCSPLQLQRQQPPLESTLIRFRAGQRKRVQDVIEVRTAEAVQVRDVLRLLAQGYCPQEIGLQRNVSVRRVYWVVDRLRRHFDTQTNEHLIARAVQTGFLV